MATLVSPGVSVTVTDESFFIPAAAPTVPLIFIATADQKLQPDNASEAEGTFEYDVVRTVTSLNQSLQLYGVPRFLEDGGSGAQYHGDARNEYGLFALNQYLGVGNRAYVIRANVNLNDDLNDLRNLWDEYLIESKVVLENLINQFINEYNQANNLIPSSPGYKDTVTATEYLSLVNDATPWLDSLTGQFNFKNVQSDYIDDQSGDPLLVYANGYGQPATGSYFGMTYIANNIGSFPGYPGGGTNPGEFTAQEGGDLLVATGDDFEYTQEFFNKTSLGSNDSNRRVAITEALAATINSNTDIRGETFDYNLILCPGYPEVVDEMLALCIDIQEEALVIADTPVDRDPDGITNPSTGWAATTSRIRSQHIAYYYPWGLASNLDGSEVTIAPSGIALRTYAFSDNVSFLWFAPAGLRRGLISGIANLGYVEGALGGPTEFIPVALNQGQRDAMYQYAASGDINPHVFFPGQGFVVWGQKTSAVAASAMDRVNVSRLIKYIKRQLRRNTLSFVFEPNDQLTRDNLKAVVDNFLGDLIVKRGLYDFATVCDESNNTPDRIDRNEMYIDVALKPVKAAEFIYIPIRILATGAEFTF
ncbi:MAG: hypothetical protein KJO91_08050 [Gammaproteobacteria bacterium]|nr:hypothetical protein [Gammaproteobacteria bacterium]